MKRCTLAPISPEFVALVASADAATVGALTARGFVGVALAQYEAQRACWWELMGRCGLPLARTEPVATATAEDVMRLAAELLRTIPGARYDCGGCRACTDAKGVEKGAHSYAIAVRFVWCTLTGRPEW